MLSVGFKIVLIYETIYQILFIANIVGCGRFLMQIASFFYVELSAQSKRKISYLKICLAFFLQFYLIIPSFFDKSPLFLTMFAIYSVFLIYGFISNTNLEVVDHKGLNKFKHKIASFNRLLGLSLLVKIFFHLAQPDFLVGMGAISVFLPILIKEIINLDSKNKIFSEKTKSRSLISLKYFEYFNIASLFFIVIAAFQIFMAILLFFEPQFFMEKILNMIHQNLIKK